MKKNNLETKPHPVDPRIAFFDHHSHTWDQDGQDASSIINRLENLQELLDIKPGQDLLEVGCGTGQLTGWLVEKVKPGKVTAIDFSQKMLEKAREKKIDAEFKHLDVCLEKPGEKLFDVIFCFHCFPHFRDKSQALCNLAHSLKSRGDLIILHLTGSREINEFHDGVVGAVRGDHLPEPDQWNTLLENAGLQKIELIDRENLLLLKAKHQSF